VSLLLVAANMLSAEDDKYANTYATTKGKIHFFSSSPLEDIEAETNSAVCVLNTQNKKIISKVTISSFAFKDKLMREHFNENYLESDEFPTAVLDMVIVEDVDFAKDGIYDVTLKGTLDMHGVKQNREIKGKLTVKGGAPVNAIADFDVKLVDHKIKIPKAVIMNIAEVIKVDVNFAFEKYQKQ
ncbi:MAG: YceI family protein, partial [Bacteroidota bacterium]